MDPFAFHNTTPLDGRISPGLATRLAWMEGAAASVIESAVAALPAPARARLAALGVVRSVPPSSPGRLRLTEHGKRTIADCASWEARYGGVDGPLA